MVQFVAHAQMLEHLTHAPSLRFRVLIELGSVEWAHDIREALTRRKGFGTKLLMKVALRDGHPSFRD